MPNLHFGIVTAEVALRLLSEVRAGIRNFSLMCMGNAPAITAATGMDALTHSMEAYAFVIATPVADAFAMKTTERVADNLHVVTNSEDGRPRRDALRGILGRHGLQQRELVP